MDALEKLTRIVPPPESPIHAGDDKSFAAVEAELGLVLPEDYKRLIRTYGAGQWQEFWTVLNPFIDNRYLNLLVQSRMLEPMGCSALDAERAVRESEGESYPHSIYPEPGGILPWAGTDNGGRFFWLTWGQAETWPTVYYADRSPAFRVYEISCTKLLYGAVSGELLIFAEEFGPDFQYGRPDAFVQPRANRSST